MPATLQTIKGKIVEIQIYLGDPETPVEDRSPDDLFTLWYRQHNLTAKIEQLARDAERDGRALEALVEMCVPVFARWDLKLGATPEQMDRLDAAQREGNVELSALIQEEIRQTVEEQEPIPIDKESLIEYVPATVLMEILRQINESRSPNTNGTGPR